MKKLRRLSRNNVFMRTPEVIESNKVILHETEGVVTTWDIEKDENTLLIAFPESETSSVFENIHNHVESREGSPEYCGIDIYHTMFSNITPPQAARVALNITEAVELTTAFVSEIIERLEGKTGNKIRLILKDGPVLLTSSDPENPELYVQMLSHLEFILLNGAAVGITVLMEIDTDTAEDEESHPAFTDAIILK